MNEKGIINYEKMARNARFKTYFFYVGTGSESVIEAIKSAKDRVYCSDNTKTLNISINKQYTSGQYMIKEFETIDANIIVGDLQQLHRSNAEIITIGNNGNIDSIDEFSENEFLGYNNVFLYDQKSKILALQHNQNGCGMKSFQALLNTYNPSILNNDVYITFSACESTTDLENIKQFSKLSLKMNIAKLPAQQGITESNFENKQIDKIAQLGLEMHSEYVTLIVGSANNMLDKTLIKCMTEVITNDKNKHIIDKFLLDCQLSNGENTELNFLSNKAQKIKDIEYGTELDYALRKQIIREHYDQFIIEKCKEL